MPEPSSTPRYLHNLSQANELGQTVIVHCHECWTKKYYRPNDLREVLGNVTINELARKMRCIKCRCSDVSINIKVLTADERVKVRIRKLIEVRMVRKFIWRED